MIEMQPSNHPKSATPLYIILQSTPQDIIKIIMQILSSYSFYVRT